MINTFVYTKSLVLGELFIKNTLNKFEVVAQRPYHDKKGNLPDGVILTLHILNDIGDYGIDKNTGKPRQTNKGQNFDVTILCGTTELDLEQGDLVELVDFDEEHSFVIGFDIIMRFKGVRKIAPKPTIAPKPSQPLRHA